MIPAGPAFPGSGSGERLPSAVAMADSNEAPPAREPAAGDTVPPGAMAALLEELAHAPEGNLARGIAPGDVVGGRFEIAREIGRGGFGLVYEARDRELGRFVAVKTVRPRRGVDPAILRAEAEAAAQLHHPNIVTVHDIGGSGGEGWLVLELLRGETLEERLRRGPVSRHEALRVATEVSRGLAHAHRAGAAPPGFRPGGAPAPAIPRRRSLRCRAR
jgi:hypothetical protein